MWLTHKNNIVRGLVGKYNNIIAMEMRQVFSNFGSLKNDVLRVLIEPLRFLILILKWFHVFIQDHGAYKHKTGRFASCHDHTGGITTLTYPTTNVMVPRSYWRHHYANFSYYQYVGARSYWRHHYTNLSYYQCGGATIILEASLR